MDENLMVFGTFYQNRTFAGLLLSTMYYDKPVNHNELTRNVHHPWLRLMTSTQLALESTTYWSATAVEKPKRPAVYCYDVNGYRVHMTEDQRRADNIGKQFAVNYFGELTVWEEFLERFCDSESRYVYQRRHGRRRRPDYFVNGAADMIKFAIRAKFRHTNVKILAVYTDKYRNPNWYTSLMVCSLSRPGKEQPRTLLQSTVFKYIPSSTRNRNFTIACAVLRFVDGHGF